MLKQIAPLRSKLASVINTSIRGYVKKGPFARRIKRRHNAFWRSADAEAVRNIVMSSRQPLTEWKKGKHWQRKLSNKYNSREFARIYNCKVPQLFWKGRDINEVEFEKLPACYVIRPTIGHSCNLVFLMTNSVNMMDKQLYSPLNIKALLHEALEENPFLEFLFEEFVKTEGGEYAIPDDYKFYMFNGEVAIIEVINRLSPEEGFISYYDKDWKMIENVTKNKYTAAPYHAQPKCFDKMIEQAKTLSKAYEIFVRIDFYATDKGAVFGEFSPTPGSANYLTAAAENLFINYWDRYCKGRI